MARACTCRRSPENHTQTCPSLLLHVLRPMYFVDEFLQVFMAVLQASAHGLALHLLVKPWK